VKLFNYLHETVDVDVDLDDPSVLAASMRVLSGDEVLSVLYRDGSDSEYDACYLAGMHRTSDCFSDTYMVVIDSNWLVDKDAFLNRKSPYWREWADDDNV
jgi:hypothetical protein